MPSRHRPPEEEPVQRPEPIRSYELPRRMPGLRWQRRRIEEEMEERSAQGWDTPINRREFLDLARKLGIGVAATSWLYPAFLAACGKTADQLTPSQGGRFDVEQGGGGETINIGVISIYSGVGAFVGKLVDRGGQLAVEMINKHGLPAKGLSTAKGGFPDFDAYERQTKGGILGGRKLRLIARDDNLSAQVAVSAIQELITRFDIKGLIFAGLYDDIYAAKKIIQQYNLPAIAAYGDLASVGQLYPKTDYRQLFQMFPPDVWGIELAIGEYALRDRGYTRFAYLGDNTAIGAQGKRLVGEVLARSGNRLLAAEQYNVGDVDMTAQLQRIRGTNCQALLIWGIAGDTAHALESLKRLDAVYIDHDRARNGPGWHPQIIGFEGGAAERTFAVLAGDAARVGTMSYWYLGGIGYIPQFQGAVETFKRRWGVSPTGGENNPADAVFLFARAFEEAGGTDPAKVINALETMEGINFSSITPHSFTKDRHISIEKADMVGVTLERGKAVPTSPPYELGTEFIGNPKADPPIKPFFPPGYVGPTHFMRFNQEALLRKHPKLYGDVMLAQGFGTQCTKRPDPSAPYGFRLTNECKIH
jgi:branched-chain amino acid transport system substrate-binding protein